jgi:hypothetical protein
MLEANYNLHLAVSTDGLRWTPLNPEQPRRHPHPRRRRSALPVPAAQAGRQVRRPGDRPELKLHDSWAPEAYWDASRGRYGILYSSVNSSGHNVIMVSYTTDFRTTTSPQVFFDPGYDVIDGNLTIGVNGVNYLYFKREGTWSAPARRP